MPGVSQAAYISFLPMTMRGGIWAVVPEGAPANENAGPTASLRFVTPGFFDTMRISLRLGRDISEGDDAKAPHVAVVSESFVRRHWPGLDPIGRRFFFAFETRTVVGVVGDVRVRGLERTSEPQVYLSYQQVPDGWLVFFTPKDLVVRSRLAPDALVPEVRRIIAAADPEQPISDVQPLADIVTADTASRRVQARVLVGFALDGISARGHRCARVARVHGVCASARTKCADCARSQTERHRDLGREAGSAACPRPVSPQASWQASVRAAHCRRCSQESNRPIRRRSPPSSLRVVW